MKKEEIEKIESIRKEFVESPMFKMAQETLKQREKIEDDIKRITKPYLDTIESIKKEAKQNHKLKIPYRRPFELDILDKLDEMDSKIKSPKKIARNSYPLPKDAKWHKLTIKFFDGHTVKIGYEGMATKTFDYKDMGFGNDKTNNPDTKWDFLKVIAENGGSLTALKYERRFSRNVKYEVNKLLKTFFGMKDDPIPRYNRTDGYKPLFNIESDERR